MVVAILLELVVWARSDSALLSGQVSSSALTSTSSTLSGYVGAMAMQGIMAYYYDHVKKDNAVELNQCRHNHMGMDVKYRHHPNWTPRLVKKEYIGGCRNTLEYCEGMFTLNNELEFTPTVFKWWLL